jgi:sensor domain CHASE-containing protein
MLLVLVSVIIAVYLFIVTIGYLALQDTEQNVQNLSIEEVMKSMQFNLNNISHLLEYKLWDSGLLSISSHEISKEADAFQCILLAFTFC